ncbi:MAG: PIN domain-containing protein [Streptosporangiales bacterium]|nr:PIN domain-containing protein [Streptosporangiales bacterium]
MDPGGRGDLPAGTHRAVPWRPPFRASRGHARHHGRSPVVGRQRALADTSVFIGMEAGRFDRTRFRDFEWGVCVVTLGELRTGVLMAIAPEIAQRRLATYQLAQRFEPIPVDEAVGDAWALLVSQLLQSRRKAPVNDCWIAATAIAHDIPLVTQDGDYDAMPGLEVVRL